MIKFQLIVLMFFCSGDWSLSCGQTDKPIYRRSFSLILMNRIDRIYIKWDVMKFDQIINWGFYWIYRDLAGLMRVQQRRLFTSIPLIAWHTFHLWIHEFLNQMTELLQVFIMIGKCYIISTQYSDFKWNMPPSFFHIKPLACLSYCIIQHGSPKVDIPLIWNWTEL